MSDGLSQIAQNLARMGLGIRDIVNLANLALGADQNGKPFRPLLIRAFRRAVFNRDGTLGIAQEVEVEPDRLAPCLQLRGRAEGYGEQGRVLVGKVLGSITEPVGFFGSIVSIGAGKEPDQHVPAGEIGETNFLAMLIEQAEGGRLVPDFELSHRFLPYQQSSATSRS